MKMYISSFLFLVLNMSFCLITTTASFGQKKTDSLSYYYDVIVNPKSNSYLAKGYNYFKNHKENSIRDNQIQKAIYDLRMMASVEKKLGLLSDSERSSVEALKLLDNIDPRGKMVEERIGIYNHLGIIYKSLNNFEKALEFYDKILKMTSKTDDEAIIINNIGNLYFEQQNYEVALEKYQQALGKSVNLNDKIKARVLSNLGHVQSKLNQPEALSNLNEALTLRRKINYIPGLMSSYNHLVEYYQDRNEKQKALQYAYMALQLARSTNNSLHLESALENLMKLNDSPEVVEYAKLKDSIEKSKQKAKDNFEYYRYQFSEKDRLFKESEQQRERLFMLLLIVFIVSIFSFFILKNKHKKEKIRKVVETESRISKKVHDELANDVYQIMSKLESENTNHEVLDRLEHVYSKSRDISKNLNQLEVNAHFDIQLKDLFLSYNSTNTSVVYRNMDKIDWIKVSELKKITIFRVLQELLTNTKKHSKASNVLVTFNKSRSKIELEYRDNGIGCALEKNNGLQNVENRIESINGKITFESKLDNGFNAKITV